MKNSCFLRVKMPHSRQNPKAACAFSVLPFGAPRMRVNIITPKKKKINKKTVSLQIKHIHNKHRLKIHTKNYKEWADGWHLKTRIRILFIAKCKLL